MFMKITELVLSLFVSYIGTLELIFTAKYFYHWLHRNHVNDKSIEEIQQYILSELTDAEFNEEHAEDLELEKEDNVLPERLSSDRSCRSSVDRARSVRKDDVGEELNVNGESNSRLNLRDSMKRSVSPNLSPLDETNDDVIVTKSPEPNERIYNSKPAMQTYHSDVYISQTEIRESPQNDISTAEINISQDYDSEEHQSLADQYRNEKSPILKRQSSNTIAIVDLNDKKIYDPKDNQDGSDNIHDNHDNTSKSQQDSEFINSRKREQEEKRKMEVGVEPNRRDSTNQIQNYCDENVVMGGVEDTLLSRLSREEHKSKKSSYISETTTFWSSETSYRETASEVLQGKSVYTVDKPSLKTTTTDFLNNERAEQVKLEGISDFYDFNDIKESVNPRKPRPPRFQPFAEIDKKPLDYEHTLKNLSDFLDYNVKMNRTGLSKTFSNKIYQSASEMATPNDDFMHSEFTSRKSSFNVPHQSMTPMNYLSSSPSNSKFFPEDQRDIEYLRRKYQESTAHQPTYAGTSTDGMHRGTGSSETLSRFQRSRSQSRSMSDLLAVERLELRRSSKRLGEPPQLRDIQHPEFVVEDDSNLDHIILGKLEDEEYHHYRRYSLCQECQVEEYPDDDDYICIQRIQVRQLSPYEIQLAFNDTPSEAGSVCATPLPDDEISLQREYAVKSENEVEVQDESTSSSKFDSGVDFDSSVPYQRNFDGNASDQFVESNEEDSLSSGYSQLGYASNKQSLISDTYEYTNENNTIDSLMLPNVVADDFNTESKSPSRNRSASPGWEYNKQEGNEGNRSSTSVSPDNVERDILSNEWEDRSEKSQILGTLKHIDESNMIDSLTLPDEAVADFNTESPTDFKSPSRIRSVSPVWGSRYQEDLERNRSSPSASSSKFQSDILSKEDEDSCSTDLSLSPSLKKTKTDEDAVTNEVNKSNKKSKRNKKKRQQYEAYSNQISFEEDNPKLASKLETSVQIPEGNLWSVTPSSQRESPNKSPQRNSPANASSNTPKSAASTSRPTLATIGKYDSLGNSELIKDGSMSPWF